MRRSSKDEEQYREIVNYLLGELADKEAEEFEQNYLGDHDTFELLEAIEEDLIEDYLSGTLPAPDRLLFEQRYLPRPENREKIDFAKRFLHCASLERLESDHLAAVTEQGRSLSEEFEPEETRPGNVEPQNPFKKNVVDVTPSRYRRPWFYSRGSAIAASIIIFLLGGTIWLAVTVRQLRGRLASTEQTKAQLEQNEHDLQGRLEAEQGNNKTLAEELRHVRDELKALEQRGPDGSNEPGRANGPGVLASTIVSLFLPPSARGAAQGRTVRLTPGTVTLDLKLDVNGFDFAAYQATVRSISGVVSHPSNVKPTRTASTAVVDVKLSAPGLKPGAYVVTLNGVTATAETQFAGEYLFTVLR